MTRPLRIGTRGSALALAQTRLVQSALASRPGSPPTTVEIIKTSGDRAPDAPLSALGGTGVFTRDIEQALLDRRVDMAVHSLKDLPTAPTHHLTIAAVLEREDPRDCLVSLGATPLAALAPGARVGTGSPRRQAQLRALRRDLAVEDMRGNLDTRLRRVMAGDFSAVVVAWAGLHRLGRTAEISEVIPLDVMCPAPGQGIVAIQIRADDADTRRWVAPLNHEPSDRAGRAERAFLHALGGGCRRPIAAHAWEDNGRLILEGRVIRPDGSAQVCGRHEGDPARADTLGQALGQRLLEEGAGDILGNVHGNVHMNHLKTKTPHDDFHGRV